MNVIVIKRGVRIKVEVEWVLISSITKSERETYLWCESPPGGTGERIINVWKRTNNGDMRHTDKGTDE